QGGQEDGAEHHIAIFTALASTDMYDHARAVDIPDLQSRHLGATRPRGVKSHQQDPVEGVTGRVNQPGDFFLTEHQGQATHLFGVGRLGHAPRLPERLNEKEAQRGKLLCHAGRIQLSFAEQVRLVFTNVLGAQLVRWTVEVAGKISDRTQVTTYGTGRVIATLEFLQHHLT